MKNGVMVWAEPAFRRIKPILQEKAVRLLALTGQKGSGFDIYVVSGRKMSKNVLAYPSRSYFPYPDKAGRFLGEVHLNPDYIRRHKEDLIYMLIHGYLHLLDYDHKNKSDTIKMENKEQELMTFLKNRR